MGFDGSISQTTLNFEGSSQWDKTEKIPVIGF